MYNYIYIIILYFLNSYILYYVNRNGSKKLYLKLNLVLELHHIDVYSHQQLIIIMTP